MPLVPRSILKQYFMRGDRPTEAQFDSLLDSTLNILDDRYLLGLRVYDPAKTYLAGDITVFNNSIFQCLATTTGVFNSVKWQMISSVGAAIYMGTWNALSNTPALATGIGSKGFYYVVSVAGHTSVDGINNWEVGDWIIFNGTQWQKVDNSQAEVIASDVDFTPDGNITATNVQDAIVELRDITDTELAGKQNEITLTPDYYPYADSAHRLADGSILNASDGVVLDSGKVFRSPLAGKAQLDFATGTSFIVTTDGGAAAEASLFMQPDRVLLKQADYGELIIEESTGGSGQIRLLNSSSNSLFMDETTVQLVNNDGDSKIIIDSDGVVQIASDTLQVDSASTLFTSLTASTVLYLDSRKVLTSSSVTPTELSYLSGLTSSAQTQLNAKLNIAGGTMTGDLVLNANPSVALGAATKQYVDTADATKLNLAGGTMTGNLLLNANPAVALGAATKQYVDTADATKLNLAGGTMTGDLVLNANPAVLLGAATKQYVDTADTTISSLIATKLNIAGGTMTGDLLLNANPSVALGAATKQYVDTADATKLNLGGGTMTGNLLLNADPTNALGAATKQYVDATDTSLQTQVNAKLNLAGGTMTGNLVLNADPTNVLGAATKQYVDTVDTSLQTQVNAKVNLAGSTMTGSLLLNANPTNVLGAATKQYVDTADATKLNLAGGTLTGNLILNANPSAALGAATKQYVDTSAATKLNLSGGTMTGNLVLNVDPTAALGAATKQYVDSVGASVKVAVIPFTFSTLFGTTSATFVYIPLQVAIPAAADVFAGATSIRAKLFVDYLTQTAAAPNTTGEVALAEWTTASSTTPTPVTGSTTILAATNSTWVKVVSGLFTLTPARTYQLAFRKTAGSTIGGQVQIEAATLVLTYT